MATWHAAIATEPCRNPKVPVLRERKRDGKEREESEAVRNTFQQRERDGESDMK